MICSNNFVKKYAPILEYSHKIYAAQTECIMTNIYEINHYICIIIGKATVWLYDNFNKTDIYSAYYLPCLAFPLTNKAVTYY